MARAKTQLYEGGHRVPAIAWWPGRIQANRVSRELSMTVDLSPTFLDLAGLSVSASKSDGVSLESHLLRDRALPERTVYWNSGPKVRKPCVGSIGNWFAFRNGLNSST